MKQLKSLIPDAASVIEMHPAELAGYVLESLMSASEDERSIWHRRNYCSQVMREYGNPIHGGSAEVGIACSTAWAWLESNGLICRHPEQDNDWFLPTRRAREVGSRRGLRQVISNHELPEEFLHAELLVNARPLFLQSRFDTAVFEAFKALEVAIREAAKLGHELVGVSLASRAFNPEDGPLRALCTNQRAVCICCLGRSAAFCALHPIPIRSAHLPLNLGRGSLGNLFTNRFWLCHSEAALKQHLLSRVGHAQQALREGNCPVSRGIKPLADAPVPDRPAVCALPSTGLTAQTA
ncbi:TIGR02391 family protein [Acidovorax sp. RAC01]|uniref:TIGR02391 family protein n=1 Tax=Acidovorax sp. RAC01 TaxID=1842533 RepID=UPI000858597B|nr:TIGR02391 family protein [Acidovorax sp. RAC01]AOG22642.1 hypothetical protein BSY15_1379 [Acidovorax sp. RAC01]